MKKNNIDKLISKLFIIILIVFSGIILAKLVLNRNIYNYTDNRSSFRFQKFNVSTFISGEYQDGMEKAISDQMPKYDLLKTSYSKISNFLNIETIYLLNLNKMNRYIKLGGVNLYKGYLLYGTTTDKGFQLTANGDIKEINNIINNTKANIYLYFVETDSNYNFETNYKVKSLEYLKEKLNIDADKIASYNISSFDDYKGYFYKTDHHWNNKGSYKGYKEIAKLMNINNIIDNNDEVCFKNISSTGSKTKNIGDKKYFKDTMCVYNFNYPKYKIIASGKTIDNYGSTIDELKKRTSISYGNIYGGDYNEIIFDNYESNNTNNLLIYGNSYTNAINKLLAANYKKTYVIDGRYYKDFDMISYINDNDIDDVLILGNCMLFWDDIDW